MADGLQVEVVIYQSLANTRMERKRQNNLKVLMMSDAALHCPTNELSAPAYKQAKRRTFGKYSTPSYRSGLRAGAGRYIGYVGCGCGGA